MLITLNNRQETIANDNITIDDLLKIKNYTFKMMVIKINGILVRKHTYKEAHITDGDNVEIIHMISGG